MAVGQLSQEELDEIYAFAVDLGRKAGKLLMERMDQRISGSEGHSQKFKEKDNSVDIVTQTDEGKQWRAGHIRSIQTLTKSSRR
jgi:myo-inositol-1(or 4)-monophosphatase